MKIGIVVCSFNRKNILANTLEKIIKNTSVRFDLVVSDDGSSDGTAAMLDDMKIEYITGENRGIAWNKNRALFYLKNKKNVDIIILIEDDTFPLEFGWEEDWISATKRWGHINLAASHWPSNFSYGKGTADDPYRSGHVSAQCAGFTKEAVELVGYFDSRFRGYGMEHVEHSNRMVKAGFGGKYRTDSTDRILYYLIKSNLTVDLIDENIDKQRNNPNVGLFFQLQRECLYRSPWRNNEERIIFLSEQSYNSRNKNFPFF